MLRSGLVSVTFRQLDIADIVELSTEANLDAIEWGGDVHCPPGDAPSAANARKLTQQAGLAISSYGSYFRLGETPVEDFGDVLSTALGLGAPRIRVWAGAKGSSDASADYKQGVIDAARTVTDAAVGHGIEVACEWHGGTLTDTLDSARSLLDAVERTGFKTYWQPRTDDAESVGLEELGAVMDKLTAVHVFTWRRTASGLQRLALTEGQSAWRNYLATAGRFGQPIDALLEFVADNDPSNFLRDAAVLRQWVDEANLA